MDLQHGTGLALGKSEGRKRRGRRFIRSATTIEREHRALSLLVKGMSQRQIAAELEMSEGGVSMLIRRALAYRADAFGPTAEAARTLLLERYERLLERWWPMATGDYVDPTQIDGEGVPNIRALDGVLKILKEIGDITGAAKPAPIAPPAPSFTGGIHVHSTPQSEIEGLKAGILATLAATRKKGEVIEGHLADARTSLAELDGGDPDDKPGPPRRKADDAA